MRLVRSNVPIPCSDSCRPLSEFQALLAHSKRFLGLLALRNVAGNCTVANNGSGIIFDGGNRHRDLDPPAILAHASDLVMFEVRARLYPPQDLRKLVEMFGREQE